MLKKALLTIFVAAVTFSVHAVDPVNLLGRDSNNFNQWHTAAEVKSFLAITESDISDLSHFTPTDIDTDYGNETVTSTWTFLDNGTGANGVYDLLIGDVTTPDYGGIQLGRTGIYSSSFTTGNIDLGGALLFRQEANIDVGNDPGIEFAWMEQGNTVRMAIPESGAGNATAFIRSGTFAGPYNATIGNDAVTCDQWSTYDANIDCDTSGTGADLFVQDDLEVEGEIYSSGTIHLDADDANQLTISSANITAARTFTFPDDEIASGDLMQGNGAGTFEYIAKSSIALSSFNDDLSYLPLAGGTLTGELVADDLGIEFTAGDTLTDCSTFSATGGGIFFDDSEGIFKKCQDNVLTDLDTGGGGGISNVVEDSTPQLGGMLDVNTQAIGDGTLELLTFVEDISAVNHIEIENEATGSGPIIRSNGDDATVELNIDTTGVADINLLDNVDVTGNIVVSGTVDGVDIAARDHDAVTFAGTPDYLTLSTQQITLNQIDLTTDVTGELPDANVADNITASNYLPLGGGTLTGQLTTDNLGVEFEDSDTNPSCAAGNYNIYADLSETTLKKCLNGVVSDLDTGGAAPEGTAVLSTGEGSTVFLRADGDNTSSWQTPSYSTECSSSSCALNSATTGTTASADDNDTSVSTTAFVQQELSNDTTFALLAGRASGQTLIGGTGANDDLTLQTTSNVTKGNYILTELDCSAGDQYITSTAAGVLQCGTDDGGGSVEGTAVLSTGETGGNKYLREDGDNTSSWQQVQGSDINNTEGWTNNAGDMVLASNQAVTGEKIFDASTLGLNDTDSAFDLFLGSTSTLTADRILTFDVNDAARTVTVSGNATITGSNTGDSQTLANGVSDVTATAAEVNLLDLSGLTAGWALLADTATTASWQALSYATECSTSGCALNSATTATTQAANDSDTSVATTAFVEQEINAAGGTGLTCSGAGVCNVDLGTSINSSEIDANTIVADDVSATLDTRMVSMTLTAVATGDDGDIQAKLPHAATLVRLSCSTSAGTAAINLYERAENAPNTGTTDMATSDLTCNSDTTADATTSWTDSAVAADSVIALGIASETMADADFLRVFVEYTVD